MARVPQPSHWPAFYFRFVFHSGENPIKFLVGGRSLLAMADARAVVCAEGLREKAAQAELRREAFFWHG